MGGSVHLVVDEGKKETVLPRIVRAAVRLFVAKGIDGATTRDIAAEARVSEGALYRHFKSKTELAWHIFSTHVTQLALELTARVSSAKDMKDKIRSYISYCFESFETHQELFTYLIIAEHRELERFPDTQAHPGTVAMAMLEAGQKSGDLKKMDLRVATSLLFGSLHRLCLLRIYGSLKTDLRRLTDDVTESLWSALKR
jgi:AcrR family transcriptional regulator